MAEKCLLFAYGLLRPEHTPPRSVSQATPDRLRGLLYDLGAYPGAVELGKAAHWIEGVTLEIDKAELPLIDAFEDTESGEFARISVETESGLTVWAYEYRLAIPAGAVPLSKWR